MLIPLNSGSSAMAADSILPLAIWLGFLFFGY
jgi:hypothetical protein